MNLKSILLFVALVPIAAVAEVDTSSAQKSYKSNYDNAGDFAGPGSTVRQLDRSFLRHADKPPKAVWREMRLQHGRWRLMNRDVPK